VTPTHATIGPRVDLQYATLEIPEIAFRIDAREEVPLAAHDRVGLRERVVGDPSFNLRGIAVHDSATKRAQLGAEVPLERR